VNAFSARRESFVSGKLPGGPAAKQDIQLANDLIPISTTGSPVFDCEACPCLVLPLAPATFFFTGLAGVCAIRPVKCFSLAEILKLQL